MIRACQIQLFHTRSLGPGLGVEQKKGKHGDGSKRTIPVFSLYFVQNPNPGLTLLTYQSAGRLAGKSNFPSTSSFL